MLHIPTLWYFDISVIYPHRVRRVKFVITTPSLYSSNICEILLYNCQLVVLFNVWANLHFSGCSPLKKHCERGLFSHRWQWITRATNAEIPLAAKRLRLWNSLEDKPGIHEIWTFKVKFDHKYQLHPTPLKKKKWKMILNFNQCHSHSC